MAEYQETLAGEVKKAKRELRKEAQEESDRVFRRKSILLSEITMALLAAYLAKTVAVLIIEKDTAAIIPLWFLDRGRDVMWLLQNLGNLYQRFYQTLITTMPPQLAAGILLFVSIAITAVLFFFICIGCRCLLQKWKKRWEYYERKGVEVFKKSVMIGIAFMGFSLLLAVMKLPLIPIRLNVVSWWILITGITEYLYFYYDGCDY